MFPHLYRQSISCILSAVLLGNTLYADGIVVDSAAAQQYRPMLESTANAISLINIVKPNSTGLSHNKFTEFNIEQRGVIFNNATSAALTQLGGWVQGNANLGTTPARVILNEVTGTNRSLLQGYGEVAGHRADLIIANPNGITVNGGGFINTPRATLTTGSAVLNGDTLSGFHVQRGDILIEGSGLNASNIDRVELYTKALQLNAKLYAKGVDAVTGENVISRDGTVTSDNVTGSEAFSIDSSALGGIYGSTIRLVGTDKGVGVNLPQITYASDSLELSADGHIILGSAVAGNTLTSRSGSLTVNELLYAGNSIDLSASDTIHNTPNALILSHGDMLIHDTGILLNDAARIEATGDMMIQADHIENLSSMTPILSTQHISRTRQTIVMRSNSSDNWNRDDLYTEKWLDSIEKTGYTPAYILSGNDMILDGAIHNRYSLIAADRDLYLLGTLNNEAALNAHDIVETQMKYVREHQSCHGIKGCKWNNNSYFGALNHTDTITDHVYSTISAGRNLYGNLISVNNADVTQGTNLSSKGVASTSYTQNMTTGAISYTLPSGGNGEFVLTTDPSHHYLIESNPLFTDYDTFISSDYIMSRLHLDTAANTKRLGDARYETQLVRDAVFRLTGERYLAGFGSDTTQYQALMDNALALKSDLNLEFGISLSASQVASLNRDIVWMEEREVSGQKVLVPVVYLASLKNQELTSGGKIIAGGDMVLAVQNALSNGGEIKAGGALLAQADTITNTGGFIKSTGDMLLHTSGDLTNTSGKISGNNVALVSDNGNIVSQTALKTIDLNRNGTTGTLGTVGESASIQSKGDMILSASKDITLTGAETSAGGNVALSAQNVTLTALEQNSHYINSASNGTSEIESVKQHSSALTAGGDVSINATKDVTLNSSSVAGNNVALTAGENVNVTAANDREFMDVQTHNKSTFSSSSKRDMTLKESVVSSAITGENITITSGANTTLQAANLKAQENIQVDAAGDINVLAKTYREASLHQESKSSFGGLVSSASLDSTDAVKLREATVKTEAKNIIMNSGKDINVVASDMSAGDALSLSSTGDTNILAGQESSQSEHWSKKSGFFSGGGNIYSSKFDLKGNADITAKGSTLDGNTVTVTSGNDTRVQGSSIVGENNVALNTGKNLTIESANERHTSEELHESSGFGIYGSSGGLGFTIGQQAKKDALNSDATLESQSRSLVGSINGDLSLNAAVSVAVKGSDLVAGNDMSIQAKNVTLQESEDAANTKETHEFRQSGLTVALTGSVVSAAQTANQMNQASQKTDNVRLKALAAMTTGLGALSAYGDVAGGGTNAIGVSATIGNTQSKSESTSQSLVHSGSSATAGGDISIIATGDGANSDITISGSDITAGKNITLKADDAITLKASEDTYSNRSSSSSSSGGVGVAATIGAGGYQLGLTANASMGRGRTNGDDALINNTHITANDTLTISSGGDTTLKGATAKADTIKADVGGNLAIESLQDTSTYASKSQNIGGSVTVGAGVSGSVSYAQTDVKSDYASVNEQSGLKAGDGGFQINVANNTDLKGGLISSSQSAIDNNKNSLTTATLTTSDIDNHADYKASSVSVSVGTDSGGVGISGAGAGFDKGSASGTTKSAISSANVTITDDAKQQELSGQTAQETIASINTDTTNANQKINQIFDAAKVTGEVEATVQIMQSFTQYAPKAVADYASAKMNELNAQAKNETDPTKKEQLQEEAAKWDEGGAYRVAAHTIVGGLAGDIAGALGAGTSAATIPAVGDMINSTDLPSEVKQTLVALAGTAIGAAAGATTGDGGALSGGATGFAQTANNYLNTVKMTDGTYKVVGGKVDKDKTIYVVKSAEDQTRTGEVVGEMLTENSFFNKEGQAVYEAIINPNDKSGVNFLNSLFGNQPSLTNYMANAIGGGIYDFKQLGYTANTGLTVDQYNLRGMPLNIDGFSNNTFNTYASARDIGNIEAGQIANAYYIPWSATTRAFDSLESSQFNENHSSIYYFLTGPNKSEQISTRQAQQIGYELPSNTIFVPNMSTSNNTNFLYNNIMGNK